MHNCKPIIISSFVYLGHKLIEIEHIYNNSKGSVFFSVKFGCQWYLLSLRELKQKA